MASDQTVLIRWMPLGANSPIRERVYLVTGKSGYGSSFLTLASIRALDNKDRWRGLDGELLSDSGWEPHHYAENTIVLPDAPETPAETLDRLTKENSVLRQHIRVMSLQDQGVGGTRTPAELAKALLELAKAGTCL